MIIDIGDKVHVMYRALYENSTRRHFVGKVIQNEGCICRLEGYVFIYDRQTNGFVRRQNKRTTIMDLAESGYIVNVLDESTQLDDIVYKYISGDGVVVTDGKDFSMNINEYSSRS